MVEEVEFEIGLELGKLEIGLETEYLYEKKNEDENKNENVLEL